jgi:DNA polymerase
MVWTERQRRMLAEMGLSVWSPPQGEAPVEAVEPDMAVAALEAPVAREAPAVLAPAAVAAPPLTGPVAQMDWPALREAVATCRACGLCETRRQTVFGVGHQQAHLMVIGEAPGEQEDRQGEPFVGAAGQLLDSMLQAIGLSRQPGPPDKQVFIANTLKCRPPSNRNPAPEELARCEPFLQRQLALVRPRVILAMGRFAVQALLRSNTPIGHLRGRVHEYQGVPLVVTYHPAYLLRNLPDKAKAWDDLCLAADLLSS